MTTEISSVNSLDQELYELLRWFGQLRWLAAGGLAAASLAGPALRIPQLWPHLFFVAGVVGAYNLYFQWVLRRSAARDRPLADRQVQAAAEIILDLSALLAAVHFTGGLRSPMLPFFVFHMAIGTMLLSNRTMYRIAAATGLGVLAVYIVDALGLGRSLPSGEATGEYSRVSDLSMLALVVTIFGTVYLTGRVSKQARQRNIQLFDVTTQLRGKTEELEGALNEIQDLERRKSHYMRISAHQLRSPLGTIKTSLQVASKGYIDPSSKRGQKMLQGTVERVDNLLAIVNDLLELAKIREGQRNAPWTQDVDVKGMLLEILQALQPLAARREVRLVPALNGRAVLAWGVPPDLRFALENLVHNAIRYSKPGGEVRVGLDVAGDRATISVADQGIGIPEDLQSDVFLEFVRAPNAKRHAPQGTGLGLSIVREAVGMHGGSVSLKSEEGVGTTFTVELPLGNPLPPGVRPVDASEASRETRDEPRG